MPILLFMNIIFIFYNGSIKPLECRLDNRIDLFNEFIVDCCSIYAMTSSDWCNDNEMKGFYGYHIVALLMLMFIVNISIILYQSGRLLYFKIRNKYFDLRNKPLVFKHLQALKIK